MAHYDLDDSIRRHPSSLAPPERHRRFGPWGILVATVSAGTLVTSGLLAISIREESNPPPRPTPVPTPLIDGPAPQFALTTLDGRTRVELSRLRGRVVVVSFGSDGCADCRDAEAALERAWRRFRGRGVVVLGVRSVAAPTAVAATSTPGPWPVVADPNGATARAYGVRDVPQTFVISPGGRVVAGLAGPVTYSVLVAQLAMVLRAAPRPRRRPSEGASQPSPASSP